MASPEERHNESFDLTEIFLENDNIPPDRYILTINTLDGNLHFLASWEALAKLRQQLIADLPRQKPWTPPQ